MKISELITILNQYLESEGNLPLIVSNKYGSKSELLDCFVSLDQKIDYEEESITYLEYVKALNLFDV